MQVNGKRIFGIDNVVDCVAILGKDGIADGFDVFYTVPKTIKVGKRTINDTKICKKTVWVREPSPVMDGNIHGFGCGTVYKKYSKKPKQTFGQKIGTDKLGEILKALKK